MLHAPELSARVCDLSVIAVVGLALIELIRVVAREPRRTGLVGLVCLPVFTLALWVRTLAPWGPHIASGRDVVLIDGAILGLDSSHSKLLVGTYPFLSSLADPLAGLEWGQIILGALVCCLLVVLTLQLSQRWVAALIAGLLAAGLVVLARVDASPAPLAPMRFFLLLTLVLAARYRTSASSLALAGVLFGCLALSFARLEAPLLVGLVLLWIALELPSDGGESTPGGFRGLGWLAGLLAVSMLAVLMTRWSLIPASALVLVYLHRRCGWSWVRGPVIATTALYALLMIPWAMLLADMGRDTSSRFPVSFMYLFGRLHILLADPWLCTPVVVVLLGLGLWRWTRLERLGPYLAAVGFPTYVLYLLFMGDTSARLKLQGIGILLFLPLVGLGASRLVERLAAWRLNRIAWTAVLIVLISGITVPLAQQAIGERTTLHQEYEFWLDLEGRLPPGSVVLAPALSGAKTLVVPPRVIQKRLGIRVREIGPNDPIPGPGDYLVYLGAGCGRFHDGKILPGVGKSLTQVVLDKDWPWWKLVARFSWNKHATLNEVFDELEVGQWEDCERLRRELDLVPVRVRDAVRSRYEGRHLSSTPYSFGLFRPGPADPGLRRGTDPNPPSP